MPKDDAISWDRSKLEQVLKMISNKFKLDSLSLRLLEPKLKSENSENYPMKVIFIGRKIALLRFSGFSLQKASQYFSFSKKPSSVFNTFSNSKTERKSRQQIKIISWKYLLWLNSHGLKYSTSKYSLSQIWSSSVALIYVLLHSTC